MRTKLRSTSNGIIRYAEALGTFLPEAAGSLSFGLGICAFIEDLPKEYNRVENMKALIQYGIQENQIDVRVRSSQAKEMIQELDRQMSLVPQTNIPNKFDWFSEFKQKDDLLQFYEYEQLPQFNKIMNLNRVDQEFFDLRFHFKATLLVKNEPKTYHVTLNEGAVLKSFLSSKVDLFNMPKFSAFYRWTFAKFQNNECVIESFISMADN